MLGKWRGATKLINRKKPAPLQQSKTAGNEDPKAQDSGEIPTTVQRCCSVEKSLRLESKGGGRRDAITAIPCATSIEGGLN